MKQALKLGAVLIYGIHMLKMHDVLHSFLPSAVPNDNCVNLIRAVLLLPLSVPF